MVSVFVVFFVVLATSIWGMCGMIRKRLLILSDIWKPTNSNESGWILAHDSDLSVV